MRFVENHLFKTVASGTVGRSYSYYNVCVYLPMCPQALYKEIEKRNLTVERVVATGIQTIYEGRPESVSVRGELTGI